MARPVILFDNGELAGLSGTSEGQVLVWNDASKQWEAREVVAVTSVTLDTSSTGLTVSGGTSQTITDSGTFTLGGILGAGYGGTGLGAPVLGDAGKVLTAKANGTYELVTNGSGTVTSVTAGTGLSGGTITGSGTISMPNVGTQGEYGSASSVAVVTTDQQGRVSAATTTTIAITQSQVSDLVDDLALKADKSVTATASTGLTGGGTLASNFSFALDTFGTAQTDQGTSTKTVKISTDAYGRVSSLTEQDIADLDASVITSGQLSLAQGGTGIDASGITGGQLLVGDTGTLALKSVSGDATLASTGAMTVTRLQGNPVSATALGAPDAGKALVWSGSEWQASTIEGGGGGGGLTFFMNYAASSPYPLSTVYDEDAGWNTGAITVDNTTAGTPLGTFVTSIGQPAIEVIPAGLWDVNFYASSDAPLNGVAVRAKVATLAGVTQTVIATSEWVYLSDPSVTTAYTASVYVPLTDVALTDRVEVIFEGRRFGATSYAITLFFGDGTIGHVHTTINAPGGTGLLKVVDGYLQSPASLLVNADVASDAAIEVAKLAAGTDTYVLTTVSGVPTWNAPAATGVTSLTGTADQVLVDATSGSPQTGALTLTLPQSIGTGSSPTFAGLTLDTFSGLLRATGGVLAGGASVSLTSEVSDTLPILNGGTNLTSSGASGHLLVSDGSAWASVPMTGDATIISTGALTLKNTGDAGTYGSASAVPVFVTDAQGRVTDVTNTSIDFASNTVTSLTGTANQVLLTGGPTGAITLSLPQSIGTGNSPTFASLTLGGTLSFSTLAYFRPASDNAIRLQPNSGNSFFFFGESRSSGTATSVFFQGGAASGTVTTGGNAVIYGGSGSGTNTSGGSVSVEGGTATGTGTLGAINIGISNTRTSAIAIGRTGITTTINGTVALGTPLAVGSGGTGVSNPTSGSLYLGAGSSAMTALTGTTLNDLVQWTGSTWARAAGQALGTTASPTFAGITTSTITKASAVDYLTMSGPVAFSSYIANANLYLYGVTNIVLAPFAQNRAESGYAFRVRGENNNAGDAGHLELSGGTSTSGDGGYASLRGGNGSVGVGGDVIVQAGFGPTQAASTYILGGSCATGTNTDGGDVVISGGGKRGTGTAGSISIGTDTSTNDILIGRAGLVTTVDGTIAATFLTLQSQLSPIYGGTGQTTYDTGDLLYASASNTLSKRQAGTEGYVLTMASGVPNWAPVSSGGVTSLAGTANQVLVGGTSGTPQTGALTLTLPQSIGTTSTPTFDQVTATTRLNGVKLYASTGATIELDSGFGGEFTFKGAGTEGRTVTLAAGNITTSALPQDAGGSLVLRGGDVANAIGNGGRVILSPGVNTNIAPYPAAAKGGEIWVGWGIPAAVPSNQASAIYIGGEYTGIDTSTSIVITGATSIRGGLTLLGTKLAVTNIAPSVTDNYVLTTVSGVVQWAPAIGGGSGTVTSVTLNGGSTGLTVSGGVSQTITTSGTFTLGGTLSTANGGTGASLTATAGGAVYGTGTALQITEAGTVGQFLKSNGAGAPTWADVTATSSPYDLRGKFVGTPASSVVLDTFIADRSATISATNTNHKFSVKTLPNAGSVVLTVQRTRTTLGVPATVTVFTATSSSADTVLNGYYPMTISAVTNGDILENDVLEVVVQASAVDAAFATPVFTISAVA